MKQVISDRPHEVVADIETFAVKEGKYWCVVAPALRVSGYGKTEKEAEESFDIEMKLFFEEAREKGTLAKLLLKYGWTLNNQFAVPPSNYVPVELLSKKGTIHKHSRQVGLAV